MKWKVRVRRLLAGLEDFCSFVFQTWEKAIELCKELAEEYESLLYDYVKLGDILVKPLTVLIYEKDINMRTYKIHIFFISFLYVTFGPTVIETVHVFE